MARAQKLKVYRMAVGFHDAYVAAPSQKAAAQAWGADPSVFTRKEAELVTDPELTAEPLARPGEVVKRLRGTAAEQIAALGEEEGEGPPPRKPAPKPKPRPSRAAVDEAEQQIEATASRHVEERTALAEREAKLERERTELEKSQREERERLDARRDKAEAAYQEALRRWRDS